MKLVISTIFFCILIAVTSAGADQQSRSCGFRPGRRLAKTVCWAGPGFLSLTAILLKWVIR